MAAEVASMENGKNESGMDVPKSELSQFKDGEGGGDVTPNGRPVRERKAVDRYSILSSATLSSTPKTLSVAKGSGTPLKDIPNVAFKLSKRKADDTLQQLHVILFGKRAKAHNLKKGIGLFSGFVWEANEDKRVKMKERLDKFVKDKLVDFCDVLNIPILKSNVKKEELVVKLLEFLESPHATTEVLLADKEKKNKKRKTRSKKASGDNSAKKAKSGEKRKRSTTGEENETDDMDDKMSSKSHSSGEEDDASPKQDSDHEQITSNDEKDEIKDNKASPKSSPKDNSEAKSGTKSVNIEKSNSEKSTKISATSTKKTKDARKNSKSAKKSADPSEKSSVTESSASPSKGRAPSSKKRQKVDEETKCKKSVSKDKSSSKKKARKSTKSMGGEEETNEEGKVEPTKEELHAVAVNILKEVDFNTATLSDILRLLGSHFGLDLMHRKREVKAVIQEVIESMSGGDSDEGGDDDNEEEGDEDDKDSGEE